MVQESDTLTVTGTDGKDRNRRHPEHPASPTSGPGHARRGRPPRRSPATIYEAKPGPDTSWLGLLLTGLLPLLVIGGFIFFMMRQAQGTNNQALSFGKSRARMFLGNKTVVTFNDVAGVDEAKTELQEVVEFLKYPEKFNSLGARIPRGVLLVGPPGTGKTLMARAVAGEAGVPFFSISGSEFVEMFVGVGASRVRDLFDQAKRNSPCIVFVDEIDAVGRQRGAGLGGSHDEREQTLNQILVEMDGFDTNTNVIVVAATNRPDVLDPALLRPGRFDRQVILDRPDMQRPDRDPPRPHQGQAARQGRRRRRRRPPVARLLRRGPGQPRQRGGDPVGAPQQEGHRHVRVPGGPGADRGRTRAQVAGHLRRGEGDHRLPRGRPRGRPADPAEVRPGRQGHDHQSRHGPWLHDGPPEEDRYLQSKTEFEDKIAGLLGGNVAERLIFGDTTTGASNDIEKATDLARRMVTEFGMSDKLGPLSFGKRDELVFLGREIGEQRNYSDEVAQDQIDEEVRAIIDKAYERATEVLTTHKDKLVALAEKLVAEETVDSEGLRVPLQRPAAEGRQPRAAEHHRTRPAHPRTEPPARLSRNGSRAHRTDERAGDGPLVACQVLGGAGAGAVAEAAGASRRRRGPTEHRAPWPTSLAAAVGGISPIAARTCRQTRARDADDRHREEHPEDPGERVAGRDDDQHDRRVEADRPTVHERRDDAALDDVERPRSRSP